MPRLFSHLQTSPIQHHFNRIQSDITSDSAASKHIILGITGGIAAYKSLTLLRLLKAQGHTVQVVMTPAATQFVGPLSFQALSAQPVLTGLVAPDNGDSMAHIHAVRQADLVLIAPASADFLAKVVHGRADDLLSALCLARGATPLALAPAMNVAMWEAAPTQRNIAQLREDGVQIWGPAEGSLACGEEGAGRMLEPEALLAEVQAFFTPKVLAGKKVMITAGPTREPIDPVRVISNLSSGKMGYALAKAAWEAGADVTLISGPTALPIPYGVRCTRVETGREMYDAVMAQIEGQEVFIGVAAVADWHVSNPHEHKIKKPASTHAHPAPDLFSDTLRDTEQSPSSSAAHPFQQLEFAHNPDIVARVAALKNGPYCVGFAAETQDLLHHAHEKRIRKGLSLLVANDVQQAMNHDVTAFVLIDEHSETPFNTLPKSEAARVLIEEIAVRLGASKAL